jgi:hypothetical protein
VEAFPLREVLGARLVGVVAAVDQAEVVGGLVCFVSLNSQLNWIGLRFAWNWNWRGFGFGVRVVVGAGCISASAIHSPVEVRRYVYYIYKT